MTIEELKKIPFHETQHLTLEDEYATTYASEDGRFGWCDHVPRDRNTGMVAKRRKAYRHYRIGSEVYKTREKFIEALIKIEG